MKTYFETSGCALIIGEPSSAPRRLAASCMCGQVVVREDMFLEAFSAVGTEDASPVRHVGCGSE